MPNPTGGTSASVGFFGKLPGAGDFVQRRLPADFVERWDRHFEHAVAASRERLGERWHDAWYASPAWRFVLAPGICGDAAWAGVMAPAADRVGRCFPMVMAASLGIDATSCGRTLRESQRWFDALEHTHAEARYHGVGADAFDARLSALPAPQDVSRGDPVSALQGIDWRTSAQWRMPLRVHGHDEAFLEALWTQAVAAGSAWCLWWTHGAGAVPASAMLTRGLPAPGGFAAFLDASHADDSWRSLRAFGTAPPVASPTPASAAAVVARPEREPPDTSSGDGHAAAAEHVPDDITVPGFGRVGSPVEALQAGVVVVPSSGHDAVPPVHPVSPAKAVAPAPAGTGKRTLYGSPDGALTMLAADDGAHDPRCRGAATAQAVAAAMEPADFSGGMQKLRERLLARHPALQATGDDLIDPVMEDAAVIAVHTTGRWAAVLRIGTGEIWQWRRGQMRPVFTEEVGPGAGVDTLLSGRRASVAVGLGGSGEPDCAEMVCAVEPGDRFLLLATRRLMSLDPSLLAQALSLPDGADARAHIAHASALGADPSPWPLAVIEIAP